MHVFSDARQIHPLVPLTRSTIGGTCHNPTTGSIHFIHRTMKNVSDRTGYPDLRGFTHIA